MAIDFKYILKTRRGEQNAAGELSFQHCIGGDGGAVQQKPDIGQRETEAFRGFLDARQKADRRVFRRCRRFPCLRDTKPRIQDLQIGKGAADINGDTNGARGGFGAQGFDPSRIGQLMTLGSQSARPGNIIRSATAKR